MKIEMFGRGLEGLSVNFHREVQCRLHLLRCGFSERDAKGLPDGCRAKRDLLVDGG